MSLLASALTCLALNLYHEARGEGPEGMLAVGVVTLNRTNHADWPDTICEVVYQPHQFSWTSHNPPVRNAAAWAEAQTIARHLIEQPHSGPLDHRALWYHNTSVAPKWAASKEVLGRIGQHVFYGHPEPARVVTARRPAPRTETRDE